MSEGTAVSLVWLLVLILAGNLVIGLWIIRALYTLDLGTRALNLQLIRWRNEFRHTFQYVEEDADMGDMWGGDDAEQEAGKWS